MAIFTDNSIRIMEVFNMQLDLDVIDGLRKIARQAGNTLYWAPNRENHRHKFNVNPLNNRMPDYDFRRDPVFEEQVLACYCGDYNARILFRNIVPSKILEVEVEQPVTFNEQETGIELDKWRNAGSTPMCVNYTETKKKTVTESLNIAAEIATEIRSKVSGGNPAVLQAEVEAKISMKLGIKYGKETKSEQSDGQKIQIQVPPWTYTTLTQKHGVSDVRQRITTHCELDAEVSFVSTNDFRRDFTSIKALQLYFNGGGGGYQNAEAIDRFYHTRRYADFEFEMEHLNLTIVSDRIYRNVATGDTVRVDSPIIPPKSYVEMMEEIDDKAA